jgi:hypothetical protein
VSDDRTRLDFTVPKSIDSSFGFTNPNTGDWLTELMDPADAKGQFKPTLAILFRKVLQMSSYKRPVLPHIRNVDAAGLSVEEFRARLAGAGAVVSEPGTPPVPAAGPLARDAGSG